MKRGREIGQIIGREVRQRRQAIPLTQEDLESLSGVPQGSISRIELGRAEDIMIGTVLKLAEALGCSVDMLLGRRAARSGGASASASAPAPAPAPAPQR